MSLANLISGGLLDFVTKVIDKVIPDPEQKAKAQSLIMESAVKGEIKMMETEMSVMLAEAKSTDPWTSRARPSFLYVIYVIILSAIPMGIVHAIAPSTAESIAMGVNNWLAAMPSELWYLFGACYLGYNAARSYDKAKANGNGNGAADIMARIGRKR